MTGPAASPTPRAEATVNAASRWARYAVLAFVFLLPWERNVSIPLFAALTTPAGVLAVFLTAISTMRAGALQLRRPPLLLLILALLALWSFLTGFWSINPGGTLVRSMTYAQLILMVWMVWQNFRYPGGRTALCQAYVLGGQAANLMVLTAFVRGSASIVSRDAVRYSIGSGNPNWLSLAIALGIPLAWFLFTQRELGWRRWVYLSYLPMSLLVLALTASRGGMVAALTALMIVPLTLGHIRWWQRLVIIGLIASSVPIIATAVPQSNLDRLLGTTNNIASGDISGRFHIWRAGLDFLDGNVEALLVGVGTTGFRLAIAPVLGTVKAPHNTLLSVLVDNGLVGLGLFLAALLSAVVPYLSFSAPSLDRSFGIVLWLVILVTLLPANWEQQKILWFMLTLLSVQRAIMVTEEWQTRA